MSIAAQTEALITFLEHYRDVGLRPILWLGAGASAAAGYPTLAGIEAILKKRLPASKATGFELIAEFVAQLSRADLAAILQKHLGEPRRRSRASASFL